MNNRNIFMCTLHLWNNHEYIDVFINSISTIECVLLYYNPYI